MGLKLYKKDTSAPCRSVHMVLEILNIPDVEYINMNLVKRDHYTDEFLKMNPQHTIPTLKDGDFVIWDSHVIATYLVNQYAKDDALYPKDTKKRAVVDLRLHFNNSVLLAALKATLIPLLYQGEKTLRQENLDNITTGYEFIEKFFIGPWLAGDSITLADICCVASISTLNEILPIDKALYPNLTAWFERLSKQEFYIKSNLPGLRGFQELLKSLLSA